MTEEAWLSPSLLKELLAGGIGALAGAWAGALAAERIAARSKAIERLRHDLRSCNAAIEFAYNVCNTYLNLKEQNVNRLYERFTTQLLNVQVFELQKRLGWIPPATALDIGQLDLSTLGEPAVDIDDLKDAIHELVS